MKRICVESEPMPFKTSNVFKIFNRELGMNKGVLDRYSEYYFIRKIQSYGDIYYLAELIKYHIGFIIIIARQLRSTHSSFEDLVNEGIIGLIKASYKYDDTHGAKFLSYAVWYIKAYMLQFITQNHELIRLPGNQFNFLLNVKEKIEEKRKLLGEDFTHRYGELADELDVPVKSVLNVINAPTREKIIAFDDVHRIYTDADTLVDVSFSIGGYYSFEEIEKTYDDELRIESLRYEIMRALRTLTDREAEIIRLFFGMGLTIKDGLVVESEYSDEGATLEEIGEVFNLTRERTRQIKEKAVRRLRHTSRSKLLRAYLG